MKQKLGLEPATQDPHW